METMNSTCITAVAAAARKGIKLSALYEKLKEPAFPGWRRAPLVAPALPEWRFQCGASRLFPSSPRSALSATRYRSLPCEDTHRKQLRRHGPCFGGCRETQDRA